MSAEVLRRAASLMRERASSTQRDHIPEWYEVNAVGFNGFNRDDREHIASWSPVVALAVADMLADMANLHESAIGHGGRGLSDAHPALIAARAYLGESA